MFLVMIIVILVWLVLSYNKKGVVDWDILCGWVVGIVIGVVIGVIIVLLLCS